MNCRPNLESSRTQTSSAQPKPRKSPTETLRPPRRTLPHGLRSPEGGGARRALLAGAGQVPEGRRRRRHRPAPGRPQLPPGPLHHVLLLRPHLRPRAALAAVPAGQPQAQEEGPGRRVGVRVARPRRPGRRGGAAVRSEGRRRGRGRGGAGVQVRADDCGGGVQGRGGGRGARRRRGRRGVPGVR